MPSLRKAQKACQVYGRHKAPSGINYKSSAIDDKVTIPWNSEKALRNINGLTRAFWSISHNAKQGRSLPELEQLEKDLRKALEGVCGERDRIVQEQLAKEEQRLCVVCQVHVSVWENYNSDFHQLPPARWLA